MLGIQPTRWKWGRTSTGRTAEGGGTMCVCVCVCGGGGVLWLAGVCLLQMSGAVLDSVF